MTAGETDYIKQDDREANYFAMCLLMPEQFVRKEVAAMGGRFDMADDNQLKILAKRFEVGVGMMTLRLSQIYDL